MGTTSLHIGNQTAAYVQEIELTFQCPVCLALETLFLEDGTLTETRHWKQLKDKVYHRNCGRPARIINMTRRKMFIHSSTTVSLMRILEQRRETIGEFATNIGVSRNTVKRWLLGKCSPNGISQKKITRYAKTPDTSKKEITL